MNRNIIKTEEMKKLLKGNWDDEYCKFIDNLEFDDSHLKMDFLSLLKCKDSKKRETLWNKLRVNLLNSKEVWKLSNPFYIGFGNPESKILFLGKEKGFDIEKHPELFVKESINNIVQWEYIIKKDSKDLFDNLGFNPLFPREYHTQNLRSRHTWGIYSQIIAGLKNKDKKKIFEETNKLTNSFFNYCFISELNHIPSKYSKGHKVIPERKDLLKKNFYQNFSKIIIGAKGYLKLEELKELFNISTDFSEIKLGENKQREIKAFVYKDKKKTVIYCDQLSGGAGWTDDAINELIKIIK
jgi:hypothetical protein